MRENKKRSEEEGEEEEKEENKEGERVKIMKRRDNTKKGETKI